MREDGEDRRCVDEPGGGHHPERRDGGSVPAPARSGSHPAQVPLRTPRASVQSVVEPIAVSFGLSLGYGILTARDAHAWFLLMMREHDEFMVETDRAGQWPMPL